MTDNKVTKVEIRLYASKLKNVAGVFKGTSDPYAVVTLLAGSPHEKPNVLGKTEVLKNDLNPAWAAIFQVDYTFGTETKFNVGIYDEVRKTGQPKSMGSAVFEIGEILGSRGNTKAKKLKHGGTVFVNITKAPDNDHGTFHCALEGVDLKNMDGLFGKSDPFFVVNAQSPTAGVRVWNPVYRSEVVHDNLNPIWQEFSIPMHKLCGGDRERPVQIEVFDWEKSGKHKEMGKFQTSVNGLMSCHYGGVADAFELTHKGKHCGTITVTKASVTGGNVPAQKTLPADFGNALGTPSHQGRPQMPEISASVYAMTSSPPSSTKTTMPRPVLPSSNPTPSSSYLAQSMPPASLQPSSSTPQSSHLAPPTSSVALPPSTSYMAASIPSLPSYPSSSYVGTSLSSLPSLPPPIPPPIPPPQVENESRDIKPKFVDYLSGGLDINMVVAIDYTGSNGDPRIPGTLHHISTDGELNDYEKALTAVGSIIARYDSDQMFPVLGFGAKYNGVINHCFTVGAEAQVKGVKGILEGYRGVFKSGLTMSGPTVFADVIEYAAAQAWYSEEKCAPIGKQSYTILLILTDGAVTDIEQTKTAIRQVSGAPLSIVVVGVGDADFSAMQFLDDFQRDEGGHTRDIVQFVEFNKHKHDRQALIKETLEEIPDQVVEYFVSNGAMPLPPLSDSKWSVVEDEVDFSDDLSLSMTFDDQGVPTLNNPAQATWDAQSYGNANHFLAPHEHPAPARNPSYVPGKDHVSTYGNVSPVHTPPTSSSYAPHSPPSYCAPQSSSSSYAPERISPIVQSTSPSYVPQSTSSSYAPQSSTSNYASHSTSSSYVNNAGYQQPEQPYYSSTSAKSSSSHSKITLQAPYNSYEGMKIQFTHPSTGKVMSVAIPAGVNPGSKFLVQL